MKQCAKCSVLAGEHLSEKEFITHEGKEYCPYCYENLIMSKNQVSKTSDEFAMNSIIGKLLRIIGEVVIVLGILVGVICILYNTLLGISILFFTCILGLISLGISEIIYLLEKIHQKME